MRRSLQRLIGQPTHHTHPHLIQAGQITPGISATEYAVRRHALLETLPPDSTVVLAGNALRYASGGIFHPFHQHTDLLYLSGLQEPDVALILRGGGGEKAPRFSLYVRESKKETEVWDGARCGLEFAVSHFGADEAYPISEFSRHFSAILRSGTTKIYTDLATSSEELQRSVLASASGDGDHVASAGPPPYTVFAHPTRLDHGAASSAKLKPIGPIIARQRVIKSQAEIQCMRMGGKITGRAFQECMALSSTELKGGKSPISESHIWGVLERSVRSRGSEGLAYVPVIAGADRGLTLHYVMNRAMIHPSETVLVDAGADWGHYKSDVTRTFPLHGPFSTAQRNIYEAVLKVQRACVAMCFEKRRTSLDAIQALAAQMLKDECARLFGWRLSADQLDRVYCHHVGHWLGLDVHDTPTVSRSNLLKEGMVVTIEPGLYIPDDPLFPEEYRGIAVRIEDDVAVGKEAPTVLTVEAPKEVDDIEALVSGRVKPALD